MTGRGKRRISVRLVAAVAVTLLGASATQAGTIAHWQFEPGSFLADASGNGNTLGNAGAVSSSDAPAHTGSGGSAAFNGSAIMQTVSALDLAPYDHIRISWWQKVSASNEMILWEHSNNYNNHDGGLIGVANSNPTPNPGHGYVAVKRTVAPDGGTIEEYDSAYATDTWEHFTAEINLAVPSAHESLKVYSGGQLVGADERFAARPAAFRSDTFNLGARPGSPLIAPFNGLLDEVKIETAPNYVNDVANHPDLVGYWRLGESGGSTAWEVRGLVGNGAYAGTAPGDFSQPGAVNHDLDTAVHFNGSSYVNAGNDPDLNQAFPGLTLAAWVKPAPISEGGLTGLQAILGKWNNRQSQDHFGLFTLDDKVGIGVASGSSGESAVFSVESLVPDEWQFVVGTWDGTTGEYEIYVDGILDPATGSQSVVGINTSSPKALYIGAQNTPGYERFFVGGIDEVAVFGAKLSAEEIFQFYATATVPEPASAALWLLGALGLVAVGRRKR